MFLYCGKEQSQPCALMDQGLAVLDRDVCAKYSTTLQSLTLVIVQTTTAGSHNTSS